ncbi:S8 family serine peptidase [Polaribacter sp. IC066]|uniref:S8 family serine peptidase n=1 Tax=Polaribacter sp. IC066 TaxID=57032 RepID=UPI0011BF56BD|nr:S8 family serine peptidase [Polaribacter sp. IC066]TXD59539.1 S8 family serine peptidase [Polaribacter sp. IC066]
MKKTLIFFLITLTFSSFSQTEDAWFFLKDKPKAAFFLVNPASMLSQRSLDRRTRQQISLDEKDVPVDTDYLKDIKSIPNLIVLGKSKWLNAVHIQATKIVIDDVLQNYFFIERVEYANKSLNSAVKSTKKKIKQNHKHKFSGSSTAIIYGNTENQVKMLKADFLHQEGFTGDEMHIAIIDAGFPNVNTLAAFQKIRDNNQILGGYNFADRNTNYYARNSHGTHVLSTIAGNIDSEFVGTAPNAKFYLFISEIAETETVLEETLWVEAAERADSLGVDIINTSLGYTTFDNPNHSYSYADMDGKTTFISRGAEIGASRGMILVNAAGNSGNDSWRYIGAPADAQSVFSIGAVNAAQKIASFSSFGPTADSRIKPDVLAQGQGTAIIDFSSGNSSTSNGTSFSSPVMAGVIACLWQAFPNKTNFEIMDLIRGASNLFLNPTDQEGYGVPNFETAYNAVLSLNKLDVLYFKVYPNPVNDFFTILNLENDLKEVSIEIFTVLGKKVLDKKELSAHKVDVSNLKKGMYILKIQKGNQQISIKLIK